jgi:HEAT repeat protein
MRLFARFGNMQRVVASLADPDWSVRWEAVTILGEKRKSEGLEPLITVMRDGDYRVRIAVAKSFENIGGTRSIESLVRLLEDRNQFVRRNAAEALRKIGDARAVEPLIAALADADREVRMSAIAALGKFSDPRSVAPLVAMLKESEDGDTPLRSALATALKELFGQDRLGHSEKLAIMSLKGFMLQPRINEYSAGADDNAYCASTGGSYDDWPESYTDIPEWRFKL